MIKQTQVECLSPCKVADNQHDEGENGLFHLNDFLYYYNRFYLSLFRNHFNGLISAEDIARIDFLLHIV